MAFQKKTAKAQKNAQPKKKNQMVLEEDNDSDMFEDMDDSEDDDDEDEEDSEEETQIQKTPQNKTPKGKQLLSEKKVSFQIPGKNTPAKTPGKDNATPAKKQSTPGKGKTVMQEFKGMKGNQNNKSKKDAASDDEDEDDDDDDDEDDDDLDLQLEDDDDLDDDDMDDDDDEDDDDEDDEEQEDKEEKLKAPKKAALPKQKGHVDEQKPTAQKGANKSKKSETIRAIQDTSNNPQSIISEVERRRQRDKKMLYVGQLPRDVTPTELKALSSDILDCVMPHSHRSSSNKYSYAFLLFASEKKAEENFEILKSKKFRGQFLKLDFVGEKSTKNKRKEESKQYNMKKLFVGGLPMDATIYQVAKFFPKAHEISFNYSPSFRTAGITYEKEEDASEAFEANRAIELNGHKLDVLHAIQGGGVRKRKRRPFQNRGRGESPAHKMKKVKTETED